MRSIIFFDTETGGLNPSQCRLFTLAAVAVVQGKSGQWRIKESRHWMLRPNEAGLNLGRTERVETSALVVNGIDPAKHDLSALTYAQVREELNFFLDPYRNEHGRVTPGGHNYSFDKGFIEAKLGEEWYNRNFSHRSVDTAAAVRFLEASGALPTTSASLTVTCKVLGVRLKKAHNALEDAKATARLFIKLSERIRLS